MGVESLSEARCSSTVATGGKPEQSNRAKRGATERSGSLRHPAHPFARTWVRRSGCDAGLGRVEPMRSPRPWTRNRALQVVASAAAPTPPLAPTCAGPCTPPSDP
eukprot:1589034-Rhodomonas_salina.1